MAEPAREEIAQAAHEAHFESLARQRLAATLGMWIFLASEVLFFGGLFVVYGFYRAQHAEGFDLAARANTLMYGSANTGVLLTSSLLVALAVAAARTDQVRLARGMLMAAAALGFVFLGIKAFEYWLHFEHGIYPGGSGHHFDDAPFAEAQMAFYSLYYVTTGLHALHVTVGILVLLLLAFRTLRTPDERAPHVVEIGGMYWHLVDMIWLFIWPMFYLWRGHS